jgi:hypothetical protein
MAKKLWMIGGFAFSIIFLVACSSSRTEATIPVTVEIVTQAATTQPAEPTAMTNTSPIEAPDLEGTGVTGILIRQGQDGAPDSPYVGLPVFLGITIAGDSGQPAVGRVDPMNAPGVRTDENGGFLFLEVEPGSYILAVRLPPNNIIMLRDPETGGDMLLEVEKDQVLDLGEMRYDFPFGN